VNLNQLGFVRAVAEAGSFTAAAARCHVTQSTLSTGVAHLERELGERIFVRTTRSVNLTAFGRRLLPHIDDVLRAETALVDAAETFLDPQARLARIGVCPLVDTARLELILAPYRKENRNVRLVLEQTDGSGRCALQEGRLDCMLGPASLKRRPALERAKLYDDPLIYLRAGEVGVAGSERRAAVRLEDIVGDTFLLVHDACGLTRLTRHLFAARRLHLREYEGQAVSYQVLEEWARLGVGSAILPQSKLSSAELGRPVVLGNGHPAVLRYEAVWSPAAMQAPHLQALTRDLKSAGALLTQRPSSMRRDPVRRAAGAARAQ
jgi:LysR family hydrogen peroxide-inducible transcriptional activator